MKKLYSIVLMAMMLLIGTNAEAKTWSVGSAENFQTAWTSAASNDVIQLTAAVDLGSNMLWLGTESIDGAARKIEIDLNGFDLSSSAQYMFLITHGSLKISNSKAAQGGKVIENYEKLYSSTHKYAGQPNGSSNVFYVTGSTNKDVDPSVDGANYFAHVEIAEGVIVTQKHYDAIMSIVEINSGSVAQKAYTTNCWPAKPALTYLTNVYGTTDAKTPSVAHGVRVDLKGTFNGTKYGIKTNGNLKSPSAYLNMAVRTSTFLPSGYAIAATDVNYSPYVHIHPTGRITVASEGRLVSNSTKNPIGIYASGYARWKVEGYAEGCVGAVVKSGDVDFESATVIGTGSTYSTANESTSGTDASGSAIVIQSSGAYSGDIDVSIGGDSYVSASNGYAIDESVTDPKGATKVGEIEITGGTFVGGQVPDPQHPGENIQGTMNVCDITAIAAANPDEKTIITIIGGQTNGNSRIGDENLAEFLENAAPGQGSTHITYVENADGSTTMVISQGEAPAVADPTDPSVPTTWAFIAEKAGETTRPSYQWTKLEDATIASGVVKLGELQINSGTGTAAGERQQLTIASGATLQVSRLVMNTYARIIVEAGANLIVDGTQGINAPVVDNILLKTSESAQAHFLFHPSVSSNRHPNATVEFLSKSYYEGGKAVYQRLGIPTYNNDVKLEYKDPTSSSMTKITYWDYAADKWHIGWIDVPATTGLTLDMSVSFGCIDLTTNNAKAQPLSYLFKGGLVGNNDAVMTFNSKFNPYANSYMAPIDIETLLSRIAENYPELSASMYVYEALANDNYTWTGVGQSDFIGWDEPAFRKIAPMQAYMLYLKPGNTSDATISYKDNVYDPYIAGGSNHAPARRSSAKKQNFMKLTIADENGIVFDRARLFEDNQFSDEFDNGYDVNKYMNEKVSLYVTSHDEAWSTLASDNVLNAYIGVNVAKSGTYTISVAHNGLDYALVDLTNSQVIDMVEGNTYSFFQEAGKNDARFQVVKINKVATAIDDVQNNDVLSTKIMKDGVLYIIKNGVVYNAQGQIVK